MLLIGIQINDETSMKRREKGEEMKESLQRQKHRKLVKKDCQQ